MFVNMKYNIIAVCNKKISVTNHDVKTKNVEITSKKYLNFKVKNKSVLFRDHH